MKNTFTLVLRARKATIYYIMLFHSFNIDLNQSSAKFCLTHYIITNSHWLIHKQDYNVLHTYVINIIQALIYCITNYYIKVFVGVNKFSLVY